MSRFDVEKFVQPPDEELICNICQGVLDAPLETPCRHVFCRVCIEKWLRVAATKSCPTCRFEFRDDQLCSALPLLLNLLNKLRVQCSNFAQGCEVSWTIEHFDSGHEHECEYRKVKCGHEKCKVQRMAKNINKHEARCGHRPYVCKKICGLTITYRERRDHHCVQLLKNTVAELRTTLLNVQEQMAQIKETLESYRVSNEQLHQFVRNRQPSPAPDSLQNSNDAPWSSPSSSNGEPLFPDRPFVFSSSPGSLYQSGNSSSDSLVGFSEDNSDNETSNSTRVERRSIVISSDTSIERIEYWERQSASPRHSDYTVPDSPTSSNQSQLAIPTSPEYTPRHGSGPSPPLSPLDLRRSPPIPARRRRRLSSLFRAYCQDGGNSSSTSSDSNSSHSRYGPTKRPRLSTTGDGPRISSDSDE